MKKECLICNEMFEALNGAKFCSACRAAVRKICTRCGEEKKEYAPREYVKKHTPTDQKSLDEKAAAARKAGLSYGKYVAVQRGLLRV